LSARHNRIKIPSPPHTITPEVQRQRLLNRVAALYHQCFQEDPKGKEYLAQVGLKDLSVLTEFQTGWVNGTLLATIPEESELQEDLRSLGLLDGQSREVLSGCVVFPWFSESGDCAGLYGLRVGSGNAILIPGMVTGIWNWQALKRGRSVILTNALLDALFLSQAGFKEVLWSQTDILSQDHLRLFQRCGTKEIYLTFESQEILAQLKEEEIAAYPVKLPPLPVEPSVIEWALKEANQQTPIRSVELKKREPSGLEKNESGFSIQYGNRRYEIKGVEKSKTKLKVTVKACATGEGKQFYLDSVDLYSHRSRVLFAKACSVYFGEEAELVQEDLGKLIEVAERFEPEDIQKVPAFTMTKEQEVEALAFLKDPNLLTRILEDFETCGYTGEEANKLMGYLAAVSRKLEDPLSVLIQSRSAAGKSTLQDAVLRFVPREDYEKYTRLTGQALFYKDENGLSHKLLAIEEEAGAREASYSIRNLQSAKSLSIATTGKDPVTGKLKTAEYQVKGPVALMLTTTSVDMDYETQNRFITLTIDESKGMTERILENQRVLETLAGMKQRREQDKITAKHQNAQRLLKPLAVVNPYALKLTFPADSLRARRDHKKYLGIIKTIAFLHQYQREIKTYTIEGETLSYIEVALADIEKANRLAGEILGQTVGELSAPSRALLGIVRGMAKDRGRSYRFTRRDIREFSGWSDFQVKTHIQELTDLEYLYSVTGKKGKEYVYELVSVSNGRMPNQNEDGKPFLAGLTKVEALNPI
jgi:DNA primase